ncbi:MAG TPA: primary-amine oxidase [Thermoanaerobaculia bacterium]|nr:primary-amine oxidase [Thermoanaerobaculia bacterium]
MRTSRLRILFGTCALSLLLMGPVAAQPASHPLDPLSSQEIRAAARALKARTGFPAEARFALVALNDPPKQEILKYKGGPSFPRQVFAVIYDRARNKTFEALVNVKDPDKPKVDSWTEAQGVQPMVLDEDGDLLEEALRGNERWIAAVKERGLEPDDVQIDFWAVGTVPEQYRGRRLLRGLTFFQGDAANFYGQPVEGLDALVDVNSGELLELTEMPMAPKLPDPAQDFDEESVRRSLGKLREAPKPLSITQPEGPSFELRGNEVSWQKWRFRYVMHPREGLVLYLVTYTDPAGQPQPVLYRASFSEMAVPYGDPAGNWNWRCAFDVGEYGVGKGAYTIEPKLDAPENAVLLDAVFSNEFGRPVVSQDVIGIYERDGGLLWKHRETGGDQWNNESRRGRELVVFTIATVGNYDYSINWIFRQDGSIHVESGLTGIMLAKGVTNETHSHDANGHLVARRVVAPHHQHILNFRLDFDVYGTANSFAEMNTRSAPAGPGNPAGTAIVMEEKVLAREKDAQRDISLADARAWRILNPSQKNGIGLERGYILVPGANSVPYSLEGSLARKRAGFMDHHVWVTRYRPRELYAGGDYPNQSEGGDGLPRYASKNEPIENTDLVLWYTLNVTHIPRPEEWPVMPTTNVGFRLIPAGFFEANPALDVPK